jgi:hypothetical protein
MAEILVAYLSTNFDRAQPVSSDRVISLLAAENSRGVPLYAQYLLSAMSSDAIDMCVAQFFEEHKFSTGKDPSDPPLVDRGAGEASMTSYRQRYVVSGRVLEAAIEFDAVSSALVNGLGRDLKLLTDPPRFRLALSIIDALEPFCAEFNQKFRPYLVEYGGTTIVGAIEEEDSLILFNAGDSRACIIGPHGVHPASLTPCHQTSEGHLTSFAGIDGIPMNATLILPNQISTIRIAKSEIPPNSYLVLWSDGYYLDFVFEHFQKLVAESPLSADYILAAMENCHENVTTMALDQNKKFSVDDRTGIVIKL